MRGLRGTLLCSINLSKGYICQYLGTVSIYGCYKGSHVAVEHEPQQEETFILFLQHVFGDERRQVKQKVGANLVDLGGGFLTQ